MVGCRFGLVLKISVWLIAKHTTSFAQSVIRYGKLERPTSFNLTMPCQVISVDLLESSGERVAQLVLKVNADDFVEGGFRLEAVLAGTGGFEIARPSGNYGLDVWIRLVPD